MKSEIDAAEDLLATIIAGRMRLRVLSHRHLSFANALLADGVRAGRQDEMRSEVSLMQDLVRQHVRTVMPPQRLSPKKPESSGRPTQVVRHVKKPVE